MLAVNYVENLSTVSVMDAVSVALSYFIAHDHKDAPGCNTCLSATSRLATKLSTTKAQLKKLKPSSAMMGTV